MTVLRNDG